MYGSKMKWKGVKVVLWDWESLWPCQASLWDGSDPIVLRSVPTLPLFIGPTIPLLLSFYTPNHNTTTQHNTPSLSYFSLSLYPSTLSSYGQDNINNNNLRQRSPRLHERRLLLPTTLHPSCSSRQGEVRHSSLRHRIRRRKQHCCVAGPLWLCRNDNQHQH